MSTPRSLPDRFHCREQTLLNDHERARRSFLKWVCKQELYGTLQIVRYGSQNQYVDHERGPAKHSWGPGYANGYPLFRNWRSYAYDQWDRVFQEVRDKWIEDEREQYRRDFELRVQAYEGRCRQRFHNSEVVEVFQLLGAASALTHETQHKD